VPPSSELSFHSVKPIGFSYEKVVPSVSILVKAREKHRHNNVFQKDHKSSFDDSGISKHSIGLDDDYQCPRWKRLRCGRCRKKAIKQHGAKWRLRIWRHLGICSGSIPDTVSVCTFEDEVAGLDRLFTTDSKKTDASRGLRRQEMDLGTCYQTFSLVSGVQNPLISPRDETKRLWLPK